MLVPEAPVPFFSRVERGRARTYVPEGLGHPAFVRTWETVGAARIQFGPQEVPEGALVNHLLTLNLGPDAVLESKLEHQDWESHRSPHHAVALWPSGVVHAARNPQPGDVLFVELAPAFVSEGLGAPPLRLLAPVQDAFSEHVLLALAAEAKAGRPTGAARVEKLVSALVAHLVELEPAPAPAIAAVPLPSPKLRRVLDYIALHLDAALTLQRLADLAEMDVFRFTRAFKQSTGSSPHRYVLEARIARAKELLSDRSLSITDIALQTGFATPSHFSVTFRRITRVTPRDFRDGMR